MMGYDDQIKSRFLLYFVQETPRNNCFGGYS